MEEKIHKKLECFIHAIDRDIDAQIEQKRRSAVEESEDLLLESERAAQEEAQLRVERACNEITQDCRRLLSKTEQDCRCALPMHRDALIEELFASVRARLTAFVSDAAYPDYLRTLLKGETLRDGAVVRLSERDLIHRSHLLPLTGGCEIAADPSIALGGLSIYYPDEQKLIDKTLDTAFDEQRRAFCNTAALRI